MGRKRNVITGKLGLLFGVIVLFTAVAFLHFGSSKIAHHLTTAVQNSVQTRCAIEKSSINFFSHFPYSSISLHGVYIEGIKETPFVERGSITFLIHPIKALWGKIDIHQLHITQGRIHVEKMEEGFNYQVFGVQEEQRPSENHVRFQIRKANLSNVLFSYADPKNKHDYTLSIISGKLNGHFNEHYISIDTELKTKSNAIQIGKYPFLKGVPLDIKGHFDINLDHGYYTFDRVSITTGQTMCEINGTIRDWKDHQSYRLLFGIEKGSIRNIIRALPPSLSSWTETVLPGGPFIAQGKITGRSSLTENPHLQFTLGQSNGSLRFPTSRQEINNTAYTISFDNGGGRTAYSSQISLNAFEGQYLGSHVRASAQIKHLNFPILNGTMSGKIPVDLFNMDTSAFTFEKGVLDITECKVTDLWLEMLSPVSLLESISCSFSPKDIHLTYQDKSIMIPGGIVRLINGVLEFDSVSFSTGQSSGIISGNFNAAGEAIERQKATLLHYSIDLESNHIDVRDFISTPTASNYSGEGFARYIKDQQISLPSGQASGKINRLVWGKRTFDGIHFQFQSTQQSLEGDAQVNTAGGKLEANFRVLCDHQYHLDSRIKIAGMDLDESFLQWENFGQQLIRSEHLSGETNGHIWLNANLDRTGRLNPKELHAMIGIQISNGRLKNFEMLDQFSNYINVKDLRNLKFSVLQNYIEIKNGHVYLPAMFIRSNAANLSVNGVHGLNQKILYNIKVNAGQVLGQQFKKHNPSLKPLPARKDGFINLYYTIYGTTKDFKYELDKKGVLSSMEQSEKIKHRVIDKLQHEFDDIPEWLEPEEWKDIPEFEYHFPKGKEEYLDTIKMKN